MSWYYVIQALCRVRHLPDASPATHKCGRKLRNPASMAPGGKQGFQLRKGDGSRFNQVCSCIGQ